MAQAHSDMMEICNFPPAKALTVYWKPDIFHNLMMKQVIHIYPKGLNALEWGPSVFLHTSLEMRRWWLFLMRTLTGLWTSSEDVPDAWSLSPSEPIFTFSWTIPWRQTEADCNSGEFRHLIQLRHPWWFLWGFFYYNYYYYYLCISVPPGCPLGDRFYYTLSEIKDQHSVFKS